MMIKRVCMMVALLVLVPFLCQGAVAIELSDIGVADKDSDIVLGEWHGGFDACLAKADAEHIPMLAMWSNAGCSHCENVYTTIVTERFINWRRGGGKIGKIILLLMKGGDGGNGYPENCPGYMWAWGPGQQLGLFPFVALYWNKPDGSLIRNHYVGETLTETYAGDRGAEALIANIETVFAGWTGISSVSGDATVFVCGTNATHRLEAEIGRTEYVDVPLARTNAVESVATNFVYVLGGDGTRVATNEVIWSAGEDECTTRVMLPNEPSARMNDVLELALADASRTNLLATSGIVFVDPVPTSVDNPLWIGERSADAGKDVPQLAFGEWTMDLDVATNRVKKAEGAAWTLVAADGSMWCPDCKRFATNLAESVAFQEWAADRQVALVELDMDRAGTMPTLLSAKPRYGLSGAGYLSRKMANADIARQICVRNNDLGSNHWNDVALPGIARLSVPTLILLDKDGRRVARLANDKLSFSPSYMIHRLNEMISAAEDSSEEANATPIRTPLSVVCPGTARGSLSAVDTRDCLAIAPSNAARRIHVTLVADDPGTKPGQGWLRLVDRSGTLVDGAATANFSEASATATVVTTLTADQAVYVLVAADTSEGAPQYDARPADTTFGYRLVLRDVLMLDTSMKTFPVTDAMRAEGVLVSIRAGEAYRFEGLAELDASLRLYLEKSEQRGPNGETLYQGRKDGDVFLPIAANATTITAAVWQSGTIGFVESVLTVEESDGNGGAQTVAIPVARRNGKSGGASVRVTLDAALSTCLEDRYRFAEQTLTWANGEEGVKTATLVVYDDTICDGDQELVLNLVPEGGGVVTIPSEARTLVLTVREDDAPMPGTLAIAATEPALNGVAKAVAPAGGMFKIRVSRNAGATGDVTGYVRMLAEDGSELGRSETLNWPHRTLAADRIRTASFTLPSRAEHAKVVFEVVGLEGIAADVTARRVVVELLDEAAPQFERRIVSQTVYRSVEAGILLSFVNGPVSAEGLRVARTAGALPPGMTSGLVEDALCGTPRFSIAGAPTQTGNFSVSYRVSRVMEGRFIQGGTVTLDLEVLPVPSEDRKDSDGNVVATGNPIAARAVTYREMPLRFALPNDPTEGATGRLAGLLTLTLSPRGRSSAKLRTANGTISYRASAWEDYNPVTGELSTTLRSLDEEESFTVTACQDSTAQVAFDVGTFYLADRFLPVEEGTVVLENPGWTADDSAARWQGRYTVQLPQMEELARTGGCCGVGIDKVVASGTGGLALRMTSTAATRGRMTFAGFLPDGRAVSGSSVLGRPNTEGVASLPIFCATRYTHNVFAGAFTIKPDARTTHADSTRSNWFISPDSTAWPFWQAGDGHGCVAVSLDAYGAYYDKSAIQLNRACENSYGCTNLTFYVDAPKARMDTLTADVQVGATSVELVPESEAANNLRLKLNETTGVFSGVFKASVDGTKRIGTYRGVVLPGWGGCEACGVPLPRPFGAGACWFRDAGGLRGKDGFQIRIDLDEETP